MGFRFRRSVRVGGARINIGKRGISSVSFGRRGRGINVGRRGVHPALGLPGTGMSYRARRSCCLLPATLPLVAGLALAVPVLLRRRGNEQQARLVSGG